jgi:rhamnogalacturonan endolyase
MRSSGVPLAVVLVTWLGKGVNAAFGVTTKGNSYSVDTDGGLVFDVSK